MRIAAAFFTVFPASRTVLASALLTPTEKFSLLTGSIGDVDGVGRQVDGDARSTAGGCTFVDSVFTGKRAISEWEVGKFCYFNV